MMIEEKYLARVHAVSSLLCVGLDSHISRIPVEFQEQEQPQYAFNRWIIEQTHVHVSAYKPNIAFYEARGAAGLEDLALTMAYLSEHHSDIVTICDAKRADIGSTNVGYVSEIFDEFGFDAVTLHPYLGHEALTPFLERKDKACIILCRTSNPGAGELQNLAIDRKPLWQVIAERVRDEWNSNHNCMLVMGATAPEELRKARVLMGDMTFLVPGIGAQGGDLKQTVSCGLNSDHAGMIINASRSIIFADEPQQAAASLQHEINEYRKLAEIT